MTVTQLGAPARLGSRTRGARRGLSLRCTPQQSQAPAAVRLLGECPLREARPDPGAPAGSSASAVTPWLYLGPAEAAEPGALRRLAITHVLSAAEGAAPPDPQGGVSRLHIALADSTEEPIAAVFQRAWDFIERGRASGGKVLVHCSRGISRSATLVISYLMRHQGLGLDAAFAVVQRARPCVDPNLGFVLCLERLEERLRAGAGALDQPDTEPPQPAARPWLRLLVAAAGAGPHPACGGWLKACARL
eukprot:TRINITY_DN55898_c0_g1_i1.p2 TRINITY_DN55898_c0_g1~~TRINITY_DN55898_c0_g1_i1.p2  ORF type:complete len:248 (+),score=76.45 TRINITY_DN55898_c0_g1_i1:91-834(+)